MRKSSIKISEETLHKEIDESEDGFQNEDISITKRLQRSDEYKDDEIRAIVKKRNLSVDQDGKKYNPFSNSNVTAAFVSAALAVIAFLLLNSFVNSKDFYQNTIKNTEEIGEMRGQLKAIINKTEEFMSDKNQRWKDHDEEYIRYKLDHGKEYEVRYRLLENRLLILESAYKHEHGKPNNATNQQ